MFSGVVGKRRGLLGRLFASLYPSGLSSPIFTIFNIFPFWGLGGGIPFKDSGMTTKGSSDHTVFGWTDHDTREWRQSGEGTLTSSLVFADSEKENLPVQTKN